MTAPAPSQTEQRKWLEKSDPPFARKKTANSRPLRIFQHFKGLPPASDARAFPPEEVRLFWALEGASFRFAVSLAKLSARRRVFAAIAGSAADVAAQLAVFWPHRLLV